MSVHEWATHTRGPATVRYVGWTKCRRPRPTGATASVRPSMVRDVVRSPQRVFLALAEEWRRETAPFSSVRDSALHPAYQRIIGMGHSALPLILAELARQPDHWFWALQAITGENPVSDEDRGNLLRMSAAWLRLGRQRGWLG